MIRTALEHIGCAPEESCIIGDRLDTDIISGVQTGIDAVLLLSGVSCEADLKRFGYRPTVMASGIDAVVAAVTGVTSNVAAK